MVHAFYDVWIVGDHFLHNTAQAYFTMRNNAVKNNKTVPFLFQSYNVSAYFNMISSSTRGLARILNPLIQALNERPRLPKMIIVVPDKDIITDAKTYSFGSTYILGKALHYLVKEIGIVIQRRKMELMEKKPGTVVPDYPKVIWVRMLKRPKDIPVIGFTEALSMRGKFNSIREEMLTVINPGENHLISITVPENDFNMQGDLSNTGKTCFWSEMDRGLKKFDLGEISLKPCNFSENKTDATSFSPPAHQKP